jgi:hypothetical protein
MTVTTSVKLSWAGRPCSLLGGTVLAGGVGRVGRALSRFHDPADFVIDLVDADRYSLDDRRCYEYGFRVNLPFRGLPPPAREQPARTSENP